ncbi:MAG TPA: DNA polymerase III subunit gamma/tau [Desulfobacteraceae bacterium]|nr:DNA polymerase III subunit gamma/tau [Desulfobacteraceae bacterium]
MSYLVLARKSRPRSFDEVVGQQAVVRTLRNALTHDRVAHAMIFSGVRGVGKTTLARIMAKALNCKDRQGPEPCNRCRSCAEINAGGSIDLVEIDGASNRGIQEIRELKENIRFLPTASPYKIIIIDEVHMLTTEAFNALLKTLEEPPDHVYFMFATTELHKVPVTILSRCQRYELKRVPGRELAAHFQAVADLEKVAVEPAALGLIVREAGGSVRDGLSLLDQVFSYCGSTVTARDVTEILGLVSHQAVAEIAEALLAGKLDEAMDRLDKLYEYGMDVKRFINDLLSWFRSLVVCGIGTDSEKLLDLPDELLAAARECAGRHPAQAIMLVFNILMEQLDKASFSSNSRFALEMAFIKAVQAAEVIPVTDILGRLDRIIAEVTPSAAGGEEDPEPAGPRPATDPAAGREVQGAEPGALYGRPPAPEKSAGQAAVQDVDAHRPPSSREQEAEGGAAGRESGESLRRSVRQHWNEFVEYVRDRKPWMASALQIAANVRHEDEELVIHYADPVQCRLLKNRENIKLLTEFALDFFQENFRIRFEVPDSNACEIDPDNGKSPLQERQALANDALVLTAVDIFNGEVGDIRVGPRFRKATGDSQDDGGGEP